MHASRVGQGQARDPQSQARSFRSRGISSCRAAGNLWSTKTSPKLSRRTKRKPRADTATVKRLARVAGMLGSEHEGERATSAQMASGTLKAMGLTWSEVIRRGVGAATSRQAHQGPAPAHETQAPSVPGLFRIPGSSGPAAWWLWWARVARAHPGAQRCARPEVGRWTIEAWGAPQRSGPPVSRVPARPGRAGPQGLALTTAQWGCLESIAEKIGWRPKERGRHARW